MLRASTTLRAAPLLRASAARRCMVATPMDDREKAFEGAWAREEQRKALDALKKTMAVKRTPINEDFETERLSQILDKAGVAKGAERDALQVRLLLWKHDEVQARQPACAYCLFACGCAPCSPTFPLRAAPAGSRPRVQVGGELGMMASCAGLPRAGAHGGCGGEGSGGKWGGSAGSNWLASFSTCLASVVAARPAFHARLVLGGPRRCGLEFWG